MIAKNKILAIVIFFTLCQSLLLAGFFVKSVTANPIAPLHLPTIVIDEDGSITPKTQFINRTGSTFTLTADIAREYSITISTNNIVFDGAGHTIDVFNSDTFNIDGYQAAYNDVGINLDHVNNVTVKNVNVCANNINAINLQFCHNCNIINVTTNKYVSILGDFNQITQSYTGVSIYTGSNNLITRNNCTYLSVGINCQSNIFYLNNFYLSDYPEFFTESLWDNGSIGNYWSNYTIRYPNASEIGNSGIGNTPYFIERGYYTSRDFPNQTNIDHYPLIYPYDIENNKIAFPTQSSNFILTYLPIVIIAVLTAVIGVSSLLYRRYQKRTLFSN